MKTIITKGEFAARQKRSPACVSNWIAEGKISKEALIGDGVRARIWLERALSDLTANLDPSQQVSQSRPIQVAMALSDTSSAGNEPAEPARQFELERQRDLARRTKADADRAEHDAEAAKRRNALDEGKYLLAEEAARIWGRELAEFLAKADTFIANSLARKLAENHDLDWKELSAEMREMWRQFRADAANDARERREKLG